MAEGEGVGKSSDAAVESPGTSAPAVASGSVFLSYGSHDAEIANSVCQFLESHGVLCWMAPRDVKPGARVFSVGLAVDRCSGLGDAGGAGQVGGRGGAEIGEAIAGQSWVRE
jgi:hypothetical protein